MGKDSFTDQVILESNVQFLIQRISDLEQKLREAQQERERSRLEICLLLSRLKAVKGSTDDFLVSVAHDILSPLSAIIGFLDLISTQLSQQQEGYSEIKESIESALTIAKYLLDHLNHVLRYYKNTDPQTILANMERITLAETVAVIRWIAIILNLTNCLIIEDIAEERQNLPILVNSGSLELILFNLLNNAKNHFQPHGSVQQLKIIISFLIQEGMCQLRVADNGSGIPRGELQRIFSPTFKGKASQGTGLGLSYVKKHVETHGGQVWAESKTAEENPENAGSTVYFTLPLASSHRQGGEDNV